MENLTTGASVTRNGFNTTKKERGPMLRLSKTLDKEEKPGEYGFGQALKSILADLNNEE